MKKVISSLFLLINFGIQAQNVSDSLRHDEVRSLINFYEYMLNTVGSANTPTRDKEVIINESYKKIFRNALVQVEDDLVEDRSTITYKDVNAYLKDVDFFFRDINFEINTLNIDQIQGDTDSAVYQVAVETIVKGITLDNEPYFHQAGKRYIEINLNAEDNDLKIVSVYSTKISREEELNLWWEELSDEWKSVFSSYVPHDSISPVILKNIITLDSLDLSNFPFIMDLDPLLRLRQLKYLNIHKSGILDLSGLRNAKSLTTLIASGSKVENIGALRYLESIKELNLSGTNILEIEALAELNTLEKLNLSSTAVTTFQTLRSITNLIDVDLSNTSFEDPTTLASNIRLQQIRLSGTQIDHLFVFRSLPEVTILDLSETNIVNLNGLETHPSLIRLDIHSTKVTDLSPLQGLSLLRHVNADQTDISTAQASNFMSTNKDVIVLTDIDNLNQWWSALAEPWKRALQESMGKHTPDKEDLTLLLNRDSLDLSNQRLHHSNPLNHFKKLRYLNISGMDWTNLNFAQAMSELEVLVGNELPLQNTSGLENCLKLRQLHLNRSDLENIASLAALPEFELLSADQTPLGTTEVLQHLKKNPSSVIIYQTDLLMQWWADLSMAWKTAFGLSNPTSFELHQLIEQRTITVEGQGIDSLLPLQVFIQLNAIAVDRIGATSINDLLYHQQLKSLNFTNSPLQHLENIYNLSNLESLNVSNTAVEDLRPVRGLPNLRSLNCSNTGIKNFKGLEDLLNIESLNVSNTRIWRLERLYHMNKLRTFVCNNTRLSQAKIDTFQDKFPSCKITFY